MKEVQDGLELQTGDEVEFTVVLNQRTGKFSACNVRRIRYRLWKPVKNFGKWFASLSYAPHDRNITGKCIFFSYYVPVTARRPNLLLHHVLNVWWRDWRALLLMMQMLLAWLFWGSLVVRTVQRYHCTRKTELKDYILYFNSFFPKTVEVVSWSWNWSWVCFFQGFSVERKVRQPGIIDWAIRNHLSFRFQSQRATRVAWLETPVATLRMVLTRLKQNFQTGVG